MLEELDPQRALKKVPVGTVTVPPPRTRTPSESWAPPPPPAASHLPALGDQARQLGPVVGPRRHVLQLAHREEAVAQHARKGRGGRGRGRVAI